jgi:hypothetical protein
MARYVGNSSSKGGIPSITILPTSEYTRATGITTDANNNVTAITLGDANYSSILYNNVGLITSYTENIGGISKNYILTYSSDNLVTEITQVF